MTGGKKKGLGQGRLAGRAGRLQGSCQKRAREAYALRPAQWVLLSDCRLRNFPGMLAFAYMGNWRQECRYVPQCLSCLYMSGPLDEKRQLRDLGGGKASTQVGTTAGTLHLVSCCAIEILVQK